MSKLVQKLIRKEGRGENAPAFPRLKDLLERLPRPASGGSLFAGTGVLAVVVVVVTLLTWLAPNSDRPVPLELVHRVLPGAAEQVEEQAAALIEGGEEVASSVVRNVREGVLGEGFRAARDGMTGGLSAPFPAVLPTPSSTAPSSPSSEEPSTSSEPSAPIEPSAPVMDSSPPATPSEPSVPPTEAPAAPSEPVAPLPIAEEHPPPAAEEPAPPAEEPAPPPAAEEPPTTETPPSVTGEPLTGAPG